MATDFDSRELIDRTDEALSPDTDPAETTIDWNAVFDEGDVEFETNVDIVLCLDLTGSMGPVIEKSKMLGRDLVGQINEGLRKKNRRVDSLRFKVCGFRDYYCDDEPMVESDFFELPAQESRFYAYLNHLQATGGGDAPENSPEALYKAFTSDWMTRGAKRRHIVLLMTDTGPHPLDHPKRDSTPGYPQDEALYKAFTSDWMTRGAKRRHIVLLMTDTGPHPLDHPKRDSTPGYPQDMPRSLEELGAVWDDGQGKLGSTERRMAIFAPHNKVWDEINETWPLVHHTPCRAGDGLNDIDMQVVVNWIANSI